MEKVVDLAAESRSCTGGQIAANWRAGPKIRCPGPHYYMKEGLLTPPVLASRNMAYYDPRCIEEIRLIKELQAKRYLPLSMIKLLLESWRKGENPSHLADMGHLLGDIFRPVGKDGTLASASLEELARESGMPLKTIKALKEMGLLSPTGKPGMEHYDDIDMGVAVAIKQLMEHGLTIDDLAAFSQYVKVMCSIAETIHARVHELHKNDTVELAGLGSAFENLRNLLAIKSQRRVFTEFHQ